MTAPRFYEERSTHPADKVPPPHYSLGDRVYALSLRDERRSLACPICDGNQRVPVEGTDKLAFCPECNGGGQVQEDVPRLMYSVKSLTIGKVTASCWFADDTRPEAVVREVRYMAEETGVGSGRVWPEGSLFPTTVDADDMARHLGAERRNR